MTQHRLVVLGSMDEFVELVKLARRQGIYTIVCDGYENGPAKAFADKAYTIDVRDIDGVADMCRAEQADGIIASFSDLLAECLVNIAAKAGLKCYCTPEKIRYLREKPLMKEMFRQLGVPTPTSIRLNADFADEELNAVGLPCVIKPANGYGSRGIYVVNSAEEIRSHFSTTASYSSFDYILAETYNQGYEFNMMTWMVDGQLRLLSIADREKSHEIEGDIPHVSRIVYPSRFTDEVKDEAMAIVKKVADFVGITTGPLSMQFFYTPGQGVQVCEIAGRMFGYEHELVTYAGGMSVEQLLLNYVYDEAALKEMFDAHDPHFSRFSAGLYFHGYEGTVADVSAAEAAAKLPGVAESLIYYQPSETIGHGVGAKPYAVRYYLTADRREELDALTRQLYEQVKVCDAQGNNLLYHNQMQK